MRNNLFFRASGDLQAILDDNGSLTEQETRNCIREVLKALEYLHRRNVAHLDIKPQNILLNSNNLEGRNETRGDDRWSINKFLFFINPPQMDSCCAILVSRAPSKAATVYVKFKERQTSSRLKSSSTNHCHSKLTFGRWASSLTFSCLASVPSAAMTNRRHFSTSHNAT